MSNEKVVFVAGQLKRTFIAAPGSVLIHELLTRVVASSQRFARSAPSAPILWRSSPTITVWIVASHSLQKCGTGGQGSISALG